MGLFDFFDPVTEAVSGWFGGDDGGLGSGLVNAALGAGDYLDNEYQAPSAQPVSYAQPVRSINSPTGLAGSALMPMISRGLSRFPNLLASMQSWRSRGVSLTVPKLMGMMRKFGPNFLVSAGILAAGAVTELMMYQATHKRRRMNALNPRALSRATRRLCSFEHRAAKVHRTLSGLSKRKSKAYC